MEIFSGSSGSLGNGKLCGKNTGQHLYIPVENDQARPLIRIIADGRLRLDASADLPSFDEFKGAHKLRRLCKISTPIFSFFWKKLSILQL